MKDMDMKIVFVCSPLKGDMAKNIENARKYCRYVMMVKENSVPFAPHLFFPTFLDETRDDERELGIGGGIEFLKACDEVMAFETYGEATAGMKQEIEAAEYFGKPVVYIRKAECERILGEML